MTEQEIEKALEPLANAFHQFCKAQMDMGRINLYEFQGAQQTFGMAFGQVMSALMPKDHPKLKEVASDNRSG